VPTSALTVALFFLFVAPGTCYELLRRRTRHPRDETTFMEVTRVLLASVWITAIVLILLALVHTFAPLALLDLPSLMLQGVNYAACHVMLTGWSVVAELALATLVAVAANNLFTSTAAVPVYPVNPWHIVAEREAKPEQEVNLSVRLKDGTEIVGIYLGASTDPEPGKRELILGAPLHVRHAKSDITATLASGWHHMVLSGAEVAYLTAEYVESGVHPSRSCLWRISGGVKDWFRAYHLTWWFALSLIAALLAVLIAVGRARGF
jgi:hypothetical protein